MITHFFKSLFGRGSRDRTQATVVAKAQAAMAANPAEAVRIIRRGAAAGIVDAGTRLSLGVFLLDAGHFDLAKEAFSPLSQVEESPAHIALKFKAHEALADAKRLAALGVLPAREPLRPGPHPMISVIICSIDPIFFVRATDSYRRALINVPHEIVGVHDARSICEGYNRGARRARGEILLFSHDDIEVIGDDFAPRLLTAMSDFDLTGLAGTTLLSKAGWITAGFPHIHGQYSSPQLDQFVIQLFSANKSTPHAQALDGCFMSVRRHVWEAQAFDEDTFRDWHLYDIDFSYRAYSGGFSTGIRGDFLLHHHQRDATAKIGSLERWRLEAEKFLGKFPHLRDTEEKFDPDQLVAVCVANDLEWKLLVEQLQSQSAQV